jgi:hypothetical protein
MSRFDFDVYKPLGLLRLSIALRFKSHILVVLHLALTFAWIATNWVFYPPNILMSSSLWLFLNILSSFSFLKANLNGLKQLTSKGCKTWEMWDGKVIISNLASYVCLITYRITCDPCPSIIRRCIFYWNKLPITNRIKKNKILNK